MVTVEPGGRVLQPYPLHQVAMVGMGPSAVQFANSVYYQEFCRKKGEREIWTLNYGYQVWQHDLLFNMRDLVHERQHNPAGDFIEAYREHPVPVVTTRFVKDIQNCYEYPFEEMFDTFGDRYFACGSSFMVAMAIMCLRKQEKGDRILSLFGFDFNYPGKDLYEAGRANLEYWIGRAIQSGIDVRVPDASTLMDMYQRNHTHKGLVGNGVIYGCQDLVPEFDTLEGKLKLTGWKSNDAG